MPITKKSPFENTNNFPNVHNILHTAEIVVKIDLGS